MYSSCKLMSICKNGRQLEGSVKNIITNNVPVVCTSAIKTTGTLVVLCTRVLLCAVVYCCCVLLSVVGCSCVLLCVVAC
jgi:hypothetical protein